MQIINNGEDKIVVLSAMSRTTDKLVEICSLKSQGDHSSALRKLNELKNIYTKEIGLLYQSGIHQAEANEYITHTFGSLEGFITAKADENPEQAILATGEMLSAHLFHLLLMEHDVDAVLLNSTDFMRLDENNEPDAEIIKELLRSKMNNYPEAMIFIAQGFICLDHKGSISNLGRGGSDYSASLIGEAVEASEIQIWTDVDGIQNNDPRFVTSTDPVRALSFDEAAELAYFGAKILHPSSVLPAKKAGIPVTLKNTLQPEDPGTVISPVSFGKGFKAIAAKDGITAIRIKSGRMLMAYGFIRKVFEIFEKYQTPVDMITTSEVAISVTIDNTSFLDEIIAELKELGELSVDHEQTIVAAVGELVANENGYARELFSALAPIPIRMISYGASQNNISLLINSSDKVNTLQAIHQGLFTPKMQHYV
jgi:aspartate kinase